MELYDYVQWKDNEKYVTIEKNVSRQQGNAKVFPHINNTICLCVTAQSDTKILCYWLKWNISSKLPFYGSALKSNRSSKFYFYDKDILSLPRDVRDGTQDIMFSSIFQTDL